MFLFQSLPSACAVAELSTATLDANRYQPSCYMIKSELKRLGVCTFASCVACSERLWHCAAGSIGCASQEALRVPIFLVLKPLCYEANGAEPELNPWEASPAESWRCSSLSLATVARELFMGLLQLPAHSRSQALDTTNARRLVTRQNPDIVLLNAMLITSFFFLSSDVLPSNWSRLRCTSPASPPLCPRSWCIRPASAASPTGIFWYGKLSFETATV